MEVAKRNERDDNVRTRSIGFSKLMEISFWGTVIWALVRIVAFFLSFTPYGMRVFSRPIVGISGENTRAGYILGFIMLFCLVAVATLLYAGVFGRFRTWWVGVAYGAALFLLFGQLFHMQHWGVHTLSTELSWFLSFGLFIGMSVSAEKYQEI